MPTRIFVDADNFIRESGASTAQTADMNWIANEFVSSENETRNGREEDLSLNETTLSGSMLLEALQEFENSRNRRGEDQLGQPRQQLTSLSPPLMKNRDDTKHTDNSINTASRRPNTASLQSCDSIPEISPPSKPSTRKQPHSRIRQPGPKEVEYMRTYHGFVKKAIGSYNRHGKFTNYRDMDEKSKDTERIFVLGLLKRLHIQDVPYSSGAADLSAVSTFQDDSLQAMDETFDSTNSRHKSQAVCVEHDSVPELHPTHSVPQACLLKTPNYQKQNASFQSENENPIEIVRSKAPIESPVSLYQGQKRTATSSGKKGADIARTRHARPSEIFGELNLYDQPSEIAESSFHELSLSEGHNLLGSVSPMSQCSSSLLNLSSGSSPGLHDNGLNDNMSDDSLSEVSSQHSMLLSDRILNEISVKPSLKTGKAAKYKPLQVNFEKKGKGRCLTQSIPNPFDGYRNSTKQKLNRLVKWIHKRNSKSQGKGLILSLSDQQVIDVILNVINTNPPDEGCRRGKTGGALIVLRTKEDIEAWCRALREGCTFSVLNHPDMPRSERISPNVAIEKLASHSIVLTTFDALKAGDATVVCDSKGVAVISQSSSQSDWQQTRSAHDVRSCKEMSLIHHLKWQHVFFVDALGKKCYLVKGGTARVTSARALNSDSRFVFVTGTNDGEPSLSPLVKSNKTAAEALSSVLHLADGDSTESSIMDVVTDLNSFDTLK